MGERPHEKHVEHTLAQLSAFRFQLLPDRHSPWIANQPVTLYDNYPY